MKHDWMIDVLADLENYALKNGLAVVAEHLNDTKLVAATEISSLVSDGVDLAVGHAEQTGNDHRLHDAGKFAG